MKIKKFESFGDEQDDNEEFISVEVTLELEPINHSFTTYKAEWESLSEEEQKELVEDELIEFMGEENTDNIQNGNLKYFTV